MINYIRGNKEIDILPSGWKGTPVNDKGQFLNPNHPFSFSLLRVLKWLPGHVINLFNQRSILFPVIKHYDDKFLTSDNILIWLGHSSFFIRVNKINILIDPQFNNTFLYKRHAKNPIDQELFKNIEYILVSHDHADHCDKRSLKTLLKNNPKAIILSGLNMDALFSSFFRKNCSIQTAAWYNKFDVCNGVEIIFVPSRHYCKRFLKKFNGYLWGGFIIKFRIEEKEFTIYYAGDSGYDDHFKDIGNIFNPDIAILGIGAYLPRWFMKANHTSPDEALKAFNDCNSKVMIPMHYGTFNLSNESMEMPLNDLMKNNQTNSSIIVLHPGKIFSLNNL